MEKVALVKCDSYQISQVEEAIAHVFSFLGGIDTFIKPGMNVLIKPNLLMKKKPEEAATTHPSIVEAIAKKVASLGANVIIADSPGVLKAEYHFRMNNTKDFSDLLVDICECVKPGISIMDAIEAMEGEGPSSGTPRHLGFILGSVNPYALDIAASRLIGLSSNQVFTIVRASERGLVSQLQQIEILGEDIESSSVKDFKLPVVFRDIQFFKSSVLKFLVNYLKPRPVFQYDRCTGCRDCANHCPPKVISFKDNRPVVDLKKCIRCFCCQELCLQKAVEIKKPWLTRKFFWHH